MRTIERVREIVEELVELKDFEKVTAPGYLTQLVQELLVCKSSDVDDVLEEFLDRPDYLIQCRAAYYALTLETTIENRSKALAIFHTCLQHDDYDVRHSALSYFSQLATIPDEFAETLSTLATSNDFCTQITACSCMLLTNHGRIEHANILRDALSQSDEQGKPLIASYLLSAGVCLEEALEAIMADQSPTKFFGLSNAMRRTRAKDKLAKFIISYVKANPECPYANELLVNVFEVAPSLKETQLLMEEVLNSTNTLLIQVVVSALRNEIRDRTHWAIPRICELLAADDLTTREIVVRSLVEYRDEDLEPFADAIFARFEHERDMYIMERLARLCVRLSPLLTPRLIELLGRVNHSRWVATVAVLGMCGKDGPIALLKEAVLHKGSSQGIDLFIAHYLAGLAIVGEGYIEYVSSLLDIDDFETQRVALLAVTNLRSVGDTLMQKVVQLAVSADENISFLALEALRNMGTFAMNYLNAQADQFPNEKVHRILNYLESTFDLSTGQSYDLSWVGDLDLVRFFYTIGKIYREVGKISLRQLCDEVKRRQERSEIPLDFPTAASTIRGKIKDLEQILSEHYGRAVSLLESSPAKPQFLSNDGREFLLKCRRYVLRDRRSS